MLKFWTSHKEYIDFLSNAASTLDASLRKKLNFHSNSIKKLTSLNLDPLRSVLEPYYSKTGRPALNQPEIFRSIILMLDMGETSLTKWVDTLLFDDLLAMLIGCSPNSLPPLGSYYDLIDRLWLRNTSNDRLAQKKFYKYPKSSKPKSKAPGKNKKLPNKHPNVVKKVADFFLANKSFSCRYVSVKNKAYFINYKNILKYPSKEILVK